MHRLRLYNTLTKQMETFEPAPPGKGPILFYTCGPTVYDFAHIGNFATFLKADLLRRTLELLGYRVRHVMNMTDVGHMTEDDVADGSGEDKMQAAASRLREAKKSGKLSDDAIDIDPGDPYAIAEYYIAAFKRDALTLGIKVVREAEDDESLLPRPTQYIDAMIELVQTLINREHAYVASDGAVYFAVTSFPAYGKLSGNTIDKLRAGEGGRIDAANQAVKKHPADFLLWKPDAQHLMRWQSPWGEGYPGWHLECSAMAAALLGETIDIHSGGEDNIFPHHECEIAQSCSATGNPTFARYWFHPRHLMIDGAKMSKSRGNFYTLSDLLEKGASPAAIRLALLASHYRQNANLTMQGIKDAQRQIDRWLRARTMIEESLSEPAQDDLATSGPFSDALGAFTSALADDLNVSGAIAALNQANGAFDPHAAATTDELRALDAMLDTLGVRDISSAAVERVDDELAARVEALLSDRIRARQERNWAEADRIRETLTAMGIAIKDGPDGTTWERASVMQ
ncbi:MAG: cysteine--tRNA ligase [Phycisphaerales bacterium]